jgi:hypothetical protein
MLTPNRSNYCSNLCLGGFPPIAPLLSELFIWDSPFIEDTDQTTEQIAIEFKEKKIT